MAVDLLQRIGLNKYESEAYLALLAEGPLTGYELGKRSSVPLSKSYETLERLTRRGLALVQPGDPPRYSAERPDRLLAQTRADQESVLAALALALAGIERGDPEDGFWVLRGRANVLARARATIDEAREEVVIGQATGALELASALAAARARGCRVVEHGLDDASRQPEPIVLLADGQEGLVGTLSPAAYCQAVVTANPALALAIRGACAAESVRPTRLHEPISASDQNRLDWLAWEDRKHERLRRLNGGGRVA
jgi:hypothetical protein